VDVTSGAEPFSHDGGRVGVLLCHGFTGSPASMRPWAEHLAAEGETVRLPLLPGHGTHWRDLALTRWDDWYLTAERELQRLRARCDQVFVAGLSMGGTLALRLAQQHPRSVAGAVVVNPSIHSRRTDLKALPLARHLVPAVPGITNDIKRPGQDEVGYDRAPLQPLYSLTKAWLQVSADLGDITCPLLVFASDVDHVVEPTNAVEVVRQVSSTDVVLIPLHDSYHVATLDNDAPEIFEQSSAFIRRVARVGMADAPPREAES
jgi:carboxylesterase